MGTVRVTFEGEQWGGATGSDVVRMFDRKWPEEAMFGSMFCACATESCAISALVGPFSPEVTNVHTFFLVIVVQNVPLFSRIFPPYFFFRNLFPVFPPGRVECAHARSEGTKNEFIKPKSGLKCFIVLTNHITGNWTNQTSPFPAD